MTENEFRERWLSERAMYDAWGKLVTDKIQSFIASYLSVEIKSFLKISAEHRLKDDSSLLDKAFYRNKGYKNPYNDIEDKVGVRFVVMLQSDAEKVCDIIKKVSDEMGWNALQCRNYHQERIAEPMLFTYQSHHFIVRNLNEVESDGVIIKSNTPCEIQVRSLLQHAYAELTHDATYKKKTLVEPDVVRTIAKTMAFIETADEFFLKVINETEVERISACELVVDRTFRDLIGCEPIRLNSAIIIYDTFKNAVDDSFENDFAKFVNKNMHLKITIESKMINNKFYRQGVVLFVYWLIKRRKNKLEGEWPLDWKIVLEMAMDVGVALNRVT